MQITGMRSKNKINQIGQSHAIKKCPTHNLRHVGSRRVSEVGKSGDQELYKQNGRIKTGQKRILNKLSI